MGKLTMCLITAGLLSISASSSADTRQALLGEWAVEAEACDEARLSYEPDGLHRAWLRDEDGAWYEADQARFDVDGQVLVIMAGGEPEHRLPISRVDSQALHFALEEESMQTEFGVNEVVLVRCPPR